MNDYARDTGTPRTVTLLGKEYKVFKLRPRDAGEMVQWFKSVVPNPKVEARQYMTGLPDAVAMHIWDTAVLDAKDWPPDFDSDLGRDLMMTDDGMARLIHICLRRGFAGDQFTLEDARDLAESIEVDDFLAISRIVMPGDPDDPLPASGATTTETVAPE